MYSCKPDGNLKEKIVPRGHRDIDKDDIRSDAPYLNPDSMHLLFFFTAKQRWTLKKMDVKSAYFQAKGFFWKIFVRPSKEENDVTMLWKLLVAAYGLTDS